jgi:proteasome alpha subunit
MFHILYDGSVTDEDGFVAMGGESDAIRQRLESGYGPEMPLADALRLGAGTLGSQNGVNAGENGEVTAGRLEVALLDRTRARRKFRRVPDEELTTLLGG